MTDTTTEQPKTLDAYDNYEKSHDYLMNLQSEIRNLKDPDLTQDSAVFIAGLYLGRMKEVLYLQNFSIEDDANRQGEEWRLQMGREGRIGVGTLQQSMIDAQNGNFLGLKQFMNDEASALKNVDVGRDEELAERLTLIAEKIPESGNGKLIKPPIPVWMEEPTPLRIQLEMLREGKL